MTDATLPALLDEETVCKRLALAPRTLENLVRDHAFPHP